MGGRHRFLGSKLALGLTITSLAAVAACSSGPRFAESYDHVPERQSASNVLTRSDIEKYPVSNSLGELLVQAYPSMAFGVSIRRMGPPLFVVDGVPTHDSRSALGISVRDIDRVELLRDGAAAFYGFRGSNGAILVTLRK